MCKSSRSSPSTATSSSSSATTATGLRAVIAIHDTTLSGLRLAAAGCTPTTRRTRPSWTYSGWHAGMTYSNAASGLNLGAGSPSSATLSATSPRSLPFGRYLGDLGGRYIVAEDVGTWTEDMENIRIETSTSSAWTVTHGGSGDPRPSPLWAFCKDEGLRRGGIRRRLSGGPDGGGAGLGHVGWHLCELLHEEGRVSS